MISGAEQIAQRLRTLSNTVGPSSLTTQFYTRVRAKTVNSIREKVSRKQREVSKHTQPRLKQRAENYSFRSLTDAVGFRVVTLYDSDLIPAFDYILDMIQAGQHLPDPLFEPTFAWDLFHEALFIKRSRDDKDPYAKGLAHLRKRVENDCRDLGRKSNLPRADRRTIANILNDGNCREEERNKDRYSSAHVIFRALSYVGNMVISIPVEFQLRTAVEDIWAEINHRLIYKSNQSLTWSHRYQYFYNESKKTSVELKGVIDNLPKIINEFSQSSVDATNAIASFWDNGGTNRFQFSLLASLFFAISNDFGASLTADFIAYGDLIASLKAAYKEGAKEAGRDLIIGALRILDRISEALTKDIKDNSARQPNSMDEIDAQLNVERLAICDLERLRLKFFLVAVFYFVILEDGSLAPVEVLQEEIDAEGRLTGIGSEQSKENYKRRELTQQFLMTIYGGFCYYMDRDLKLRPLCMIMFFKHLVALLLDTPLRNSLTRKNLLGSYELLDTDRTIPAWSIYKVLLPRYMASFQLLEAKDMLKPLEARPDVIRMASSLRKDIQTSLVDALSYALRATKEHIEGREDERRGDILFGFERNDHVKDVSVVVDICWTYLQHFSNIRERLLPEQREGVIKHLNAVSKMSPDGEDNDSMHVLRERAVQIVSKLLPVPPMKTKGQEHGKQHSDTARGS